MRDRGINDSIKSDPAGAVAADDAAVRIVERRMLADIRDGDVLNDHVRRIDG